MQNNILSVLKKDYMNDDIIPKSRWPGPSVAEHMVGPIPPHLSCPLLAPALQSDSPPPSPSTSPSRLGCSRLGCPCSRLHEHDRLTGGMFGPMQGGCLPFSPRRTQKGGNNLASWYKSNSCSAGEALRWPEHHRIDQIFSFRNSLPRRVHSTAHRREPSRR